MTEKTPFTDDGLRQYDNLDPITATIAAWRTPGPRPDWHERARATVREVMPVLGRALDRLAGHRSTADGEQSAAPASAAATAKRLADAEKIIRALMTPTGVLYADGREMVATYEKRYKVDLTGVRK